LGLGLSKCWRIVTNHGGRIDVANQPGHGAAFTVTLPATGLAAELNNKK
jgi:signal transduction histidine kinase